jgi:hypothetical protein
MGELSMAAVAKAALAWHRAKTKYCRSWLMHTSAGRPEGARFSVRRRTFFVPISHWLHPNFTCAWDHESEDE